MDIFDIMSQKLMIIIGIIMYICGLFGNILNIIIFTQWVRSRKTANNNSPLYLLATSVANFIMVLYPLLVRILVDGYRYPVTTNNVFILCKLRYYVLQTSLIISLICTCLGTFDRYLKTSRQIRLRQLSATKRTTIKIIFLIICLSALHNIPTAIYHDFSMNGDCVINSKTYFYYYLFIIIGFIYGIFPICFLSIFGILTYKQVKLLRQTNMNIDKQLSRMILFQCIVILLSSIPYCIQEIYFLEHSPFSFTYLFRMIAIILFYTNPVISFYIFFITTPNFRCQVKKIFLSNNQVNVIR